MAATRVNAPSDTFANQHVEPRNLQALGHRRGLRGVLKRWIVERTLTLISRCRRLARNLENLARTTLVLIHLAMIKIMARASNENKVSARTL
jgi:transposase